MDDRSRGAPDLIVVVRIPKSASLSLSAMALKAFPDRQVFALPNTLDLDGQHSFFQRVRHARHVARLTLKHYRTLSLARVFERINQAPGPGVVTGGHIDFETCRKAFTRGFQILTLIRNPIDRSFSEYDYARHGFEKKPFTAKFDASLIAKAAGRYSYEGYLDFLLERRAAFGDIACRYLGCAPGIDFARHFRDHVFHFGLLEDMRTFAAGLARKTGHEIDVQHLNSSASVSSRVLSSSERRKVEDLYARDLALYEWCRRQDRSPGVQAAVGGT